MHTGDGPIPTFNPSAPALMMSSAASFVAMFPAMISTVNVSFSSVSLLMAKSEWQCAMSRTMTSAPASMSA